QQGFLQGWAIVENTSPTDWKNVALTLTSGSPVTYQQALYPSYFVQRPVLPLPIPNTIAPRIDRGVMRQAQEANATSSMMLQKSARATMAAPAPAMAMDTAVSEEMAYGGAGASFAGAQNLTTAAALTTQQSFT